MLLFLSGKPTGMYVSILRQFLEAQTKSAASLVTPVNLVLLLLLLLLLLVVLVPLFPHYSFQIILTFYQLYLYLFFSLNFFLIEIFHAFD